jgi:ribonucleoside-diphosphate reductase alpha chain
MSVNKVKKRNGKVVSFNKSKITNAVKKALNATNNDPGLSRDISNKVTEEFNKKYSKQQTPTVEEVQDIVEKTLIKDNLSDVAKAYILYRNKQTQQRDLKDFFGVQDDLKLNLNAIKVLRDRYLKKNEQGEIIETPSEMFERVAKKVASADNRYSDINVNDLEKKFFEIMVNLEFLPNSPTLMNAGLDLPQQLSACFVLPVDDSLDSIFDSVKNMALIHKSGGGTGFSFSKIRPQGDIVKTTKGIASGPISFMKVFDKTTNVVKQGGRRRGANMGILRFDHPDIISFVNAKDKEGEFENFNLSVSVTDDFIEAIENDEKIDIFNPRTKNKVKSISAKNLFDQITFQAWKTGDPGLIFLDEINKKHPLKKLGEIEATNPCGEVPLLPFESCNLGSINLSKMVNKNRSDVDWEKLDETVKLGVHFLDNIIDVSDFPLPEIEKTTKANRKIGLGVMGFAELLIKLDIPYNSKKALNLAENIMKFITEKGRKKSEELGKTKGSFPNFDKSIWKQKHKFMRNATITTIAPTGTISVIAGCSSGIEPLFAVAFIRNIMEGKKFFEVNSLFEKQLKKQDIYDKSLIKKIAKKGSIQNIDEIPSDLKKIFLTAMDIKPDIHVKIQAAFQKHTDNAVSKTVNLPRDCSIDTVKNIYLLAHKLKCKGITIYRYGSKQNQVLSFAEADEKTDYFNVESNYSGGCPFDGSCEM